MTDMPFSSLPLPQSMLEALDSLGYRSMTPVQAQSLPAILAGQDVIAQASTGTGKTAAFAIGLLRGVDATRRTCQALVLCPTRELADQVAREVRRLARNESGLRVVILSGGLPMGPQTAALENGAHVIVGTPGRVLKHLSKDSLQLNALKVLVLDEADRMLDMGFFDSIADVVRQAPATRQTLLFSATYPASIGALAERVMRDPQRVEVAQSSDNTLIEQRFYEISDSERTDTLLKLLACYRPQTCLVFCVTRQQCQTLADALCRHGVAAAALHGDMEQRERDQVLMMFSHRSLSVLVATDVAARGLDIEVLDLVVNAELSRDLDTHTHRIGRTGRAGQRGLAVSLVAPAEVHRARTMEAHFGSSLSWHPLNSLKPRGEGVLEPTMVTLGIAAGRKDKLRPGDVLGALTKEAGLRADQVGKITITDQQGFVAVHRDVADQALRRLSAGKIKGKALRVRVLGLPGRQ